MDGDDVEVLMLLLREGSRRGARFLSLLGRVGGDGICGRKSKSVRELSEDMVEGQGGVLGDLAHG